MNNPLALKNQLCHRFYTLSSAFNRAYRPLLSKLDVTYPQYVVLLSLWEEDAVTISRLVEHTRVDSGAMSLILKKLEKKGFITFTFNDNDRRSRIVTLTPFGREKKDEAVSIPHQMRCNLQNITDEEARMLVGLLDKLTSELDETLCSADK